MPIDYVELDSDDLAASRSFFAAAFGWRVSGGLPITARIIWVSKMPSSTAEFRGPRARESCRS
ncbi:hypothetical protein KKY_2887 [Pelagibacterium halotolerans B2]|uniref:VOC domain-containing protein n=1 Tax=Pelagibacterium halotolerans (strain DSM 22347 / JCM 15775 / CGMCC 1.7692 / B2) TaxID=1082931 RepID=G4RED7_PELHB|nr:hypothetical protein KKY_2887 [Pelagibacterium halotolerans B2]